MKKFSVFIIFCIIISFCLSTPALFAQVKQANDNSAKTLTTKDKALIIEIFKSLPASQYHLSFNWGSERHGNVILTNVDVINIRTGKPPADAFKYLYLWTGEIGLLYVILITKSGNSLETFFGKTNAAKLQAVLNKYSGDNK